MSSRDLPVWEYATAGNLRDRLAGLTLAGAKTATFGIDDLTLVFDEPLEEVGVRLGDVTWEQVDAEGESFVDVADWREAHEGFWEPFVPDIRAFRNDPNWRLDDDTIVTCVWLTVIERLGGHDDTRMPVVECVVTTPDDLAAVQREFVDLGWRPRFEVTRAAVTGRP